MKWDFKVVNWIASYPKSGNTWVRFLYQAHQVGLIDINSNSRVTHSDSMRWPYAAVSSWPLETIPLEVFPYLRAPALMLMISAKSEKPFVCKTHCSNSSVNRTRLIPYELTRSTVYLVRDPRDVVVSYSHHFREPYDKVIDLLASEEHVMGVMDGEQRYTPQYVGSWSMNVQSWTEDPWFEQFGCVKPLVIRYEDLLTDTKKHFLDILKLWEVEPKNVDEVIRMCRLSELQKQEKANGFLEAKFDDEPFFRKGGSTYKDVLTKSQEKQILKDHGKVMEKFEYI